MTILGDYWDCFGNSRVYHHTLSSSLLYGLREALSLIVKEGLENVIRRHQLCAQRLQKGLKELDLELFVQDERVRLTTVTGIKVPNNVNWRRVSEYAMKKYKVEISGGLGPTACKIFRIGLLGYNATFENVDLALKVLKEGLEYGYSSKL
uniref:alanine--glyoxylate transaminase n=1 Tax=Dendroctonus ponderosae TaxID=77166 RepID=J3JTX7_DENPD|nr:unknown [Dendroctonus ponderosae]